MTDWKVVESSDVQAGVITISQECWATLSVQQTEKVKVVANGKARYLSALCREGARGGDLFVAPGIFKITGGATPAATLETMSAGAVRASMIFKTWAGIFTLFGLVLAIAGTAAQAVNSTHTMPSTLWIVIASVAQVLGLLLVFFRGVWNLAPS